MKYSLSYSILSFPFYRNDFVFLRDLDKLYLYLQLRTESGTKYNPLSFHISLSSHTQNHQSRTQNVVMTYIHFPWRLIPGIYLVWNTTSSMLLFLQAKEGFYSCLSVLRKKWMLSFSVSGLSRRDPVKIKYFCEQYQSVL